MTTATLSKVIGGYKVTWNFLSGLIHVPREFFGDGTSSLIPSRVLFLEKMVGEVYQAKTQNEFDFFFKMMNKAIEND